MSRRKSTEKCEIFAGFESRVELGLKEFDMQSLKKQKLVIFHRVIVVKNLTVTIDQSFDTRRCVSMEMCVIEAVMQIIKVIIIIVIIIKFNKSLLQQKVLN